MTSNTLAYASNVEARRHNIMEESVKQNTQQEQWRHNVAQESATLASLQEQKRHNYSDENKNWFSAYSGASAQATQAAAALQNAIANQQSVIEQRRHNLASEQYESALKLAQAQYVSGPQTVQGYTSAALNKQTAELQHAQTGKTSLEQGLLAENITRARIQGELDKANLRIANAKARYAEWNAATDTVSRTIKPVSDIFHGYQSVEDQINGTNIPTD